VSEGPTSDNRRVQRVEKELREIVSSFVIRHFTADLLNVTQVRVTKDLKGAKVYVSALGKPAVSQETLDELQYQASEMQREVMKHLRMKYCPRLQFLNDEGVATSQKINELINKIKQ
jgi:ribosome-binding factor A